ncbi:hypothetical protein NPIL_438501 [Nephila pilipes]|uniref:Uncharacterized protein n=1 Tax=Nephila pilipes TaxID=299642 RepID=A0A8X6QHM6_NEPPI|nr:hypothetical protein NPIL_438501 [Nephila pilipes]
MDCRLWILANLMDLKLRFQVCFEWSYFPVPEAYDIRRSELLLGAPEWSYLRAFSKGTVPGFSNEGEGGLNRYQEYDSGLWWIGRFSILVIRIRSSWLLMSSISLLTDTLKVCGSGVVSGPDLSVYYYILTFRKMIRKDIGRMA